MAPACGIRSNDFSAHYILTDVQGDLAVLVGGFISNMADGAVLGSSFPNTNKMVRQPAGNDGRSYFNGIYHGNVLSLAVICVVAAICVLISMVCR